jgi:hypothetical protein
MEEQTMSEKLLPEVVLFEKVQAEWEAFKNDNADVLEAISELLDRYNSACDMAEKAVRAKGVSQGPFQQMGRPTIKWDADKLYEEMGKDFFLAHGGTITQVPKYTIDKNHMEAAVAAKQLPPEVVQTVRSLQLRYHSIKRAVLP